MDNDLVLPEDMSSKQLLKLQAEYITHHGRLEAQRNTLEKSRQADVSHKLQRIALYLEQLERNIQLIDMRLGYTEP